MQIWENALGNESRPCERRISNEIHDILEHSIDGWQRVKNEHGGRCKLKKYGTQICYERVEKKVTIFDEFVPISKTVEEEIDTIFK